MAIFSTAYPSNICRNSPQFNKPHPSISTSKKRSYTFFTNGGCMPPKGAAISSNSCAIFKGLNRVPS